MVSPRNKKATRQSGSDSEFWFFKTRVAQPPSAVSASYKEKHFESSVERSRLKHKAKSQWPGAGFLQIDTFSNGGNFGNCSSLCGFFDVGDV
jgi:hypothetical protein